MAFWRTYYHLVWATKNRAELIRPELEGQLYQYLVNKAAESQVHVFALGGWIDHIHLLVAIPPKHSVATIVKRLKGSRSFYVNSNKLSQEPFAWQRGYGVFTLGESQLSRAEAYVRGQKEHHNAGTVNAWLERVDEDKDEPDDGRLQPDIVRPPGRTLREDPDAYLPDYPFP